MQMKKLVLLSFLFVCSVAILTAQTTVTGKVYDSETNEPLIGATVKVVDFPIGTITEIDGSYSMNVPEKASEIRVSYTGYTSKKEEIAGRTTIDFAVSSGKTLEEVIVIGYGKIKKSDATGAISSVKPEDDEVVQYDNFQDFLQGRAAGVYIQGNGSDLGSPISIRIRGANSLRGDNEPLYVVDGIIINSSTEDAADPLQGGSSYLAPQSGLGGINPQDIASIEVLKDASATAIYGSRGANGVILITTKKGGKGKDGKAKINYKLVTRTGQATRLIDVLDTDDFVDYQNEFRAGQGFSPKFYRYSDGTVAQFQVDSTFMEAASDSLPRLAPVNWYEDILQNSFLQNHRLSISGGKKKSDYYVAFGYSDAKGIVPGTRSQQGDFILNYTEKITNRIEINPRISTSLSRNSASKGTENIGGFNSGFTRDLILSAPFIGFADNNVNQDAAEIVNGPRSWLQDYDDDSKEIRTLASLRADIKLSDVFTYRFLAGGDYRNKTRQLWFGRSLNRGNLANGEAGISTLNRLRYNIDNTIMFDTKLGKKSKLNGTVGVVYDATNVEQTGSNGTDFAVQDLRYEGIRYAQNFSPLFYDFSNENILSFLGRANYSLSRRYLFTVSFRADGSSKFAAGNKFSFFPSAAFAWKLSSEKFLRNSEVITDLKLRVGYGRTGSQAIRPYQTFTRYVPTANLLSDGSGGGVTAIIPQNIGNPKLIWETTDQINAGIDFGLYEDRIAGSLDYYNKKTSDLLQQFNIGPSAGFANIVTNKGDLINQGVELGLIAYLTEGKVKWSVRGNISVNRNRITNLGLPEAEFGTRIVSAFLGSRVSGGTTFKVPANIFIEGEAAGLFWGYQTDGIIVDDASLSNAPAVNGIAPQLGDVLYRDQNGDGIINEKDLTVIGDPNPDFTFGIGSEVRWKNLSLNLFFNGVQGNDIANGNLAREDFALGNSNNVRQEAFDGAWRPGKTDATHARLGYPIQGDFTDRFVEDGSFIRLTYVNLSYDIPTSSIKGLGKVSVFASGQNLLLITKYSGFDPEVNSFAFDPLRSGLDWGSFPNQKAVSAGVNITF